jgi:hypothetical protein
METNRCEEALSEMLRRAEPKLREKYGDDSAVQILDEVLYPIAEKLIEKSEPSSEHAIAEASAIEATPTKTDREQLEQMLTVPIEEMVSAEVLQVIRNAVGACIDELDECTTDEEYFTALDHAFKSMVLLGRWSVLQ